MRSDRSAFVNSTAPASYASSVAATHKDKERSPQAFIVRQQDVNHLPPADVAAWLHTISDGTVFGEPEGQSERR